MRLLFCSQNPLDARLGAAKVLIELAAELEALGWRCTLASSEEICPGIDRLPSAHQIERFREALAPFLQRRAPDFDAVDYDHLYLPGPRARFAPSTALVARVPLLHHHFEKIAFPPVRRLRSRVGALVNARARRRGVRELVRHGQSSVEAADLVNVSNEADRDELASRGIDPRKIAVLPLGLTDARLASFGDAPRPAPAAPRVAFVGTFNERKGAGDFPAIARGVLRVVPGAKFRLLGSTYNGEAYVRSCFPRDVQPSLEVVPRFEPEALPALLADCSVGVFPSYVEGFGFGVLEMLAASLPVVAYDVPGPPVMLSPEYLVPRGAAKLLGAKAAALLADRGRLEASRAWAHRRAREFTWRRAAALTSSAYAARVELLQGASRPARAGAP